MQLNQEIEEIIVQQHSLGTRAQLRAAGYSDHQIARLGELGVLRRVRAGVYAVVGVAETWERGLHAAVLAVGDQAWASHAAAARLWGFVPAPERRYEITVPRERYPELLGVRIHRSCHVDDEDLTVREGIPSTTFERTLCDCSALLTQFELGRVLDDGLRRRVASLSRLEHCAERLESGPGRHMSVVRALLAERDGTFDPGGSAAELRVMRVLRRARLPLPVQQYEVTVRGATYRPDYAWPEVRVFAEYYGAEQHSGPTAVIYDSARVTALATEGWLPLIFTKASTDREIIESVASALAQRRDGRHLTA